MTKKRTSAYKKQANYAYRAITMFRNNAVFGILEQIGNNRKMCTNDKCSNTAARCECSSIASGRGGNRGCVDQG